MILKYDDYKFLAYDFAYKKTVVLMAFALFKTTVFLLYYKFFNQ